MTTEFNLIGDVAGEYDTLQALVAKMPNCKTILVGDMVDRGPKSAQVLNLVMDNLDKFGAVLGNHDHMMLSALAKTRYYPSDVWSWNGGGATVRSYHNLGISIFSDEEGTPDNDMKKKVIAFLQSLPLYIQQDGLFVSHAFPNPSMPLPVSCDLERWGKNYSQVEMSIIWNRGEPRRMKDFYQVTGHNSHWGLRKFSDKQGEYGICLDTSRSKILTGMHWPSMQIFQQEYIVPTDLPFPDGDDE